MQTKMEHKNEASKRSLFCCHYARLGDVAEAARCAGYPAESAAAEGAALLRQAGIPTVGGMDMLVQQAACAQEIWYEAQFSEADLAALTQQAQAQLARQEAHP